VTQDLRSYKACQFSTEMSQSQPRCHKDVTYDTNMRLRGLRTQTGRFADRSPTRSAMCVIYEPLSRPPVSFHRCGLPQDVSGGCGLDVCPCSGGEFVVHRNQRVGLQLGQCDVLDLVDVGPVQLGG
jgi:hypothetical protein